MSRRRRPFVFLLPFLTKRQRFIIAVVALSLGLFATQHLLGKSGVFVSFLLSFLTVFFLFLSNHQDIKQNFSPFLFVLPFFYSLAFGLFYFLVPARFLTRLLMTSLYAGGLYSLFLSENIFTVASMRTIALLSSARTVSFIITIISYFFLSNVIFSLNLPAVSEAAIVFSYTFLLTAQSIWSYTFSKLSSFHFIWVFALSSCLFELSLILWFWPSDPTFIALFLTGIFYTFVGLSHVWLDKRLFRNILWEYIWVSVIVFCILFLFTSWKP
ncbi:MAG: hypothetical protein HYV39_04335 [Candidatus Levybacteria bacterium]|nr:hypothetical protein [Candidatus Levybacteria bacterium]